jgi:hypothetical protein
MWRTGWKVVCALALVLLLWAPVVAAPADEDSPLAQIPAGSPIVVHLHGVERTKGRLYALIKSSVPDLAKLAESKIEEGIKKGLDGRELKGLAKDGPIFFAFTEMPKKNENLPKMVFIVKVTNYAEFRDGFLKEDERKALKTNPGGFEETAIDNQPTFFVDRKNYAIITLHKEIAEQFTKKQPGLDGKIDKALAEKLLDSDLGVYVDTVAVRAAFGQEIKEFQDEMRKAFEEGVGGIGIGGANKNSIEMVKLVMDPAFQAFEDGQAFIFTAELRPEGLALHAQATVGADSKTNELLKAAKPTAMAELGLMPAGQVNYAAMHMAPAYLKKFGPYIYGVVHDPDSKEAKAILDAVEQIAASNPKFSLAGAGVPPKGLQAWIYEDPARAATSQLKLFESLKAGESYSTAALKEKPEIKPDAKKHRGFNLHYVSLTWDLEATAAKSLPMGAGGLPADFQMKMAEGMKKLVGEGSKMWFGSDGKSFVTITADDWESAQQMLDNYLDKKHNVGQDKAFTDARKQLPAEVTLLSLVDLPAYAAVMAEYLQSIIPDGTPFPVDALKPAVKGKSSYMGFSVTLQPQRGSADFWLPASAVTELFKMFGESIMKNIGAVGS